MFRDNFSNQLSVRMFSIIKSVKNCIKILSEVTEQINLKYWKTRDLN